jgi:hypothetical protein
MSASFSADAKALARFWIVLFWFVLVWFGLFGFGFEEGFWA